jgi:hypothetical protein
MTLDLDAINAEFAKWPVVIDGMIHPTERPQLTREQYDRALEQWVATLPPNATQIAPPLWVIHGRPGPIAAPLPTPEPEPEPEPHVEPQPEWFACFGRRTSDARAYIGLGVIEPDGSEREERYHPAVNTRLYALLERYITETDDV